MPWSGGVYTFPSNSWNPAVTGTQMSSADWNTLRTDLADGVSFALPKDGSGTATDRIPFAQGIELASGSVGAPSLNFTSDADSGFFYTGSAVAGVFGGATVFSWNAAGLSITGTLAVSGRVTVSTLVNIATGATVTIASGAVTITQSHHFVDTEGGASSDDLDTINGGTTGDVLFLQSANASRDVTVKHAIGNIQCGSDRVLSNPNDVIMLRRTGSNWGMISFADNTV